MSIRRTILVLTIVTLALPLALFASQASQRQQAVTSASAQRLMTHVVGRGDVEVTISAIGQIEADARANLSFTRAGRVVEVLAEAGQMVTRGDVLARLDSTAEQVAYQQAELVLEAAVLALEDLLDGPDEGDIRIAEANVVSAQGAYSAIAEGVSDEEIAAAELAYEQARQAYEDANRARRVAGSSNEETIALLDARIGQASFDMEIARLRLEQLRNSSGPDLNAAGARIAQAQAELERVLAGPTEAQIRQAEVTVEQAQTDLDQAAANLERLTLRAPFDGVIGAVNVEVGALVTPGEPVIELVDTDPLRVTVAVDEIDIRRVREGMPASVRLDALSGVDLPAVLERIALVGETREGITSYDVRLALTDINPRARVGMTAEAEVVVESRENVIVVPNAYVRLERRLNRAFVNIMQPDGSVVEVPVELGLQGDEFSEIVSGLNPGDVIAVDPAGQGFSFFGS